GEQFLAAEVLRSGNELETANREVAKFLSLHPEFALEMKAGGGGTGGGGGGTTGLGAGIKAGGASGGDRELMSLLAQKARLEQSIATVKAGGTVAPPAPAGTPAQEARVAKARRDLEEAEKSATDARASLNAKKASGLTDAHPDVVSAKAQ